MWVIVLQWENGIAPNYYSVVGPYDNQDAAQQDREKYNDPEIVASVVVKVLPK